MKNFKLFIFDEDRVKLIDKFQKFNYVHIDESKIDQDLSEDDFTRPRSSEDLIEIDDKIKRSKEDIDLLLQFKEKENPIKAMKDGVKNITLEELAARAMTFPFEKIDGEIKVLVDEKDKNNSKIQNIDSKIGELKPWENLSSSLSRINDMGAVNIYTGTISSNHVAEFESEFIKNELAYIERVSKDKNFYYYLMIVEKSIDENIRSLFSTYGFTPINIKADGKVKDKIDSYERDKEFLYEKNKNIEEDLKTYLKYLEDFKFSYEFYRNEKIKIMSERKFLKTTELDLIEGYVPSEKLEDFENEVKKADKPILVDFYADWCGPCQMQGPIVEKLAKENDSFKVGKVNVDEQQELAMEYGVMSIPTLMVVKNGEITYKETGVLQENAILDLMK